MNNCSVGFENNRLIKLYLLFNSIEDYLFLMELYFVFELK